MRSPCAVYCQWYGTLSYATLPADKEVTLLPRRAAKAATEEFTILQRFCTDIPKCMCHALVIYLHMTDIDAHVRARAGSINHYTITGGPGDYHRLLPPRHEILSVRMTAGASQHWAPEDACLFSIPGHTAVLLMSARGAHLASPCGAHLYRQCAHMPQSI